MSGVNSEETVGGPNACHHVRVSSWNIHLGCVFQAWRLVAADFCLGLSLGMGVGTLSSWSHPEITQNLFIPQQISVGSQLRLSAIVRYTLAIIGCLFHLEKPTPLKSPAHPYLLQLNLLPALMEPPPSPLLHRALIH